MHTSVAVDALGESPADDPWRALPLSSESLVTSIAPVLAAVRPSSGLFLLGFGGLGGHGIGGAAGVVIIVGLMGMRMYMRSRRGGRGPRGRGPWR